VNGYRIPALRNFYAARAARTWRSTSSRTSQFPPMVDVSLPWPSGRVSRSSPSRWPSP
jgi:hypothetical protein